MEGYAKIASFMGKHPESAVGSRFSDINLQNILYLQAEIHGLRQDLRKHEAQSGASSSADVRDFALDWYLLANTNPHGEKNQQWQKVVQLRQLLKEYNEAVLQFYHVSKLVNPKAHDLRKLQEWLRRSDMGAVYLTGRDRDIWANGEDLMSIMERQNINSLTYWIAEYVVPIYMRLSGRYLKRYRDCKSQCDQGLAEYPDYGIAKVANLLGTVLASVLPVVAIVLLHLAQDIGLRLGLIALFSVIFSTCLWFLNDGRLIEVFSATATFAAVQVVFIGTN